MFGGERIGDRGSSVQNTAFAEVAVDATIMREEIFSPVSVSTLSFLETGISGLGLLSPVNRVLLVFPLKRK